MLPQFPEGAKSSWVGYNFVTCNDIRVALARTARAGPPCSLSYYVLIAQCPGLVHTRDWAWLSSTHRYYRPVGMLIARGPAAC